MRRRHVRALAAGPPVVAVLVCVTTGAVASGPAVAGEDPCAAGSGVTVVVDPGDLGGAVETTCAPVRGGSATDVLASAGVGVERVRGLPGFVCRVDRLPVDADCGRTAPANGYWGLFSTVAGEEEWTYATLGVDALRVPDGGSLGWAWQDGGALDEPRTTPAATDDAGSGADAAGDRSTALPAWTAPAVLTGLTGAVAGALLWRRRRREGP